MTVDLEKAIDSIYHSFLMCLSKKKIDLAIQILMKNPELCVINGSKTTPYFKFERGTRQGDLISA